MSYLIRTNSDQLLLLNQSTKNGLYSQALSSNGLSRPVIINRSNTSNYTATIDHNQDLHIITQPSKEQIIHLHYKNNNVNRSIILEDPKGIYNFSNLYALSSKEHVHLFYTANQPIGDSCELIHHILCQENKIETRPILSFESEHLGFNYMAHDNKIFLLYGEKKETYLLQIISYQDGQWLKPLPVASSPFPIDDFQFCISNEDHIHVVYVQEKYGRYHLIYKKQISNIWSDETILHTSATAIDPCIFTYHRGIWVNFLQNNRLQMILSMDNGNTFSKNVDCSLQSPELERCNFVSAPETLASTFSTNMLYASLTYPIRTGIIANIDMINLHPDIKANIELELLLDGTFHALAAPSRPVPQATISPDHTRDLAHLQAENQELKQIQEQMITQYNDMTDLTKKIQEEGKKWRIKALSLESQINENSPQVTSNPNNSEINATKNQDL